MLPGAQESIKALDEKLREGEQTNVEGGESSNFLWIIDPIDGTTNFVHGMPLSAVSIACTYEGQVLVGIVYDPYAGGTVNNISNASSSEVKKYQQQHREVDYLLCTSLELKFKPYILDIPFYLL